MPPAMLKQYSKVYFGAVQQAISKGVGGGDPSPIDAALATGPALPKDLQMSPLEKKQKLMNKIMKKYIEKVGSDPAAWVREAGTRPWEEKLLGLHPDRGGLRGVFAGCGPRRKGN